MTSIFVGDVPAPIVVPFDSLGSIENLSGVTGVTAKVAGIAVPVTVQAVEQTFTVTAPTTAFPGPGLYPLVAKIAFLNGGTETHPVEDIVVEQVDGWHTLASARDQWGDAPTSDAVLYSLLSAAQHQCEVFAPASPSGQGVPVRYRQAQIMQTRALWQSTKTNSAGEIGEGGFTVQVFPMDWSIKALLRPRVGFPVIV